jgi:hypothetical protein
MKTTLPTLTLLSLLSLLAACGNPHLNSVEGLGTKKVPLVATPQELDAKGIRVNDGLSLSTDKTSITDLVELQNLDLDKTWMMKVEFEKGENFQFNGTGFPGTKGTCRTDLKGSENCAIEIKFHSTTAGLFADNLKISYATAEEPLDIREISYSLRGERISKNPNVESKITIQTVAQEDKLDFGKSIVSSNLSSSLIVKNIGAVDVALSAELKDNREIIFTGKDYPGKKGTCSSELAAGKECLLEVSFDSSAVGLYQDQIILNHSPLPSGSKQTIYFPILGEKTAKKIQGPLILSEVFSSTIDFGKVKVGVEVKKQFEIQNLGETTYSLKEYQIKGRDFHFSGSKYPGLTGTCSEVILPGSCLIEIAYTPKEIGKESGSFKFETKEGDSVELKLLGEGAEEKKCESYNEYLAIPEKSYPASSVVFPYLKSHSSTTATLTQLYGQQVNSYVKEIDTYTVKDGMVYITFKFPKMEGEITNMNFGVHVLKVIRDNFKDTESLCLSSASIKKCSGHQFELASWQKLKNPKFWDKFAQPVSDRYEKQFASGEKKCGPYNCMNLNTAYELSDIFELSKEEMAALRKDGVLTLIFSDDTRTLKMPRIAIKTKVVVSCE